MVKEYKVVFVNVEEKTWQLEKFPLTKYLGPIDLGVDLHLNKFKSFMYDVFHENNALIMGCGPFAGGKLFGTHRLIFVFRSPHSRGLHVSAMGGAAYSFVRSSVHAIVIYGKSNKPLIIGVWGNDNGSVKVEFREICESELWRIFDSYNGYKGVYGLTRYTYEIFKQYYVEGGGRSVVVGPAAVKTIHGALVSIGLDKDGNPLPGQIDLAARGGGGSVLYKAHKVVGIVFGGKYNPAKDEPKLVNTKLADELSKRVLGKEYGVVVAEATKKYRFDPKLGTGGTFGVNYILYRDLVPGFAFNTIYYGKALRLRIHKMVMEYFWKPFQEKVFKTKGSKPWHTCGEPCPGVCKKTWNSAKVDYEPFNGLGFLIGVLRFEDAKELVELVDTLGFDAIEVGHIVAWVFDLMHRGLLQPGEVGVNGRPHFDPLVYNPEKHSPVNKEIARKIIEGLVRGDNEVLRLIGEKGIRIAAKELDKKYIFRVKMSGLKFEDVAVYAAFGEQGYMSPNYYWSPGMVAPLYILGRYWTSYSPTFSDPEELAESAARRAVVELAIDNAGVCRFHRHWAEKLLPYLYRELIGVEVDVVKHSAETYKKLIEYQEKAGAVPAFWESRKTIELVATIAAEVSRMDWSEKIITRPGVAREWWERFKKRFVRVIDEMVSAGAHSSS